MELMCKTCFCPLWRLASFIQEVEAEDGTCICLILNYTLVYITWQSVHINLIGFNIASDLVVQLTVLAGNKAEPHTM